ncbi:MAG: Hsp20/alpha crystallin family protein, partial [Armatimonadetes bacterium]
IDVELVGDVLTIRGKREFSDEEKRDDYVRIERSYGSFQRSFTIGVPVKADEISATYRDGILTVVVPKADEVKPRKIEVKTN